MVRLLPIQAYIAVLRRAIAISRKLKPRTWTYLAITQAVLAALCFWGYRQYPQYEVGTANQVVIQIDSAVFDHVLFKGFSKEEEALIRKALPLMFAEQCTMAFYSAGLRSPWQVACDSGVMIKSSSDLYVKQAEDLGVAYTETRDYYQSEFSTGRAQAGAVPPFVTHIEIVLPRTVNSAFGGSIHGSGFISGLTVVLINDYSSTTYHSAYKLPFWQFLRFEPPTVLQVVSGESRSLLDVAVKMLLLFQAIIFTIGSATSSVFLYLNYRRGQLDLKLKALQVREMEIKLENMERERARMVQEAAQSGIILLS